MSHVVNHPSGVPGRPADRYGDKPHLRRRALVALLALGVAVTIGAVAFIVQASQAQIRTALLSWDEPVGDTMSATVEVLRRPDTVVTCDLVAVDIRQAVVGQTVLEVPATPERRVVVEAEIPLQGDAVAASVRGCQAVP